MCARQVLYKQVVDFKRNMHACPHFRQQDKFTAEFLTFFVDNIVSKCTLPHINH